MGALVGYAIGGGVVIAIIAIASFSEIFQDEQNDESSVEPSTFEKPDEVTKPNIMKEIGNEVLEIPETKPSTEVSENKQVIEESTKYTCTGQSMCINDKVTRIVDGDTIHVGSYTIRLALVDTPERNETGYSEASKFTSSICPIGSFAIVDQDDLQPRDKYDRIVGKVICSGKNLNEELLQNNHAIFRDEFCKTSEFAREKWNPC